MIHKVVPFRPPQDSMVQEERYQKILILLWCQYVEETNDFSSYQPLLDWVNLNIIRMNPNRDSLYSSEVVTFNQKRANVYTDKIAQLLTLAVSDGEIGCEVFHHLPSLLSELREIAACYQKNATSTVKKALESIFYIEEFVVAFNDPKEQEEKKKLFPRLLQYLETLPSHVYTVNSHLQSIQGI